MTRSHATVWICGGLLTLCALGSLVTRRGAQEAPIAPPPRKQRCVILFHGLAPRRTKASCFSSAARVAEFVLPILVATVLEPNGASFAFDLVAHSWPDASWSNFSGCEVVDADAADRSRLIDVFAAYDFGKARPGTVRVVDRPRRPARRETAAFESLAAAVRLGLDLPAADWFLALRLDVVFYSPFLLTRLDARNFYVAHQCVPLNRTRVESRVFRSFNFAEMDTCAPDFYFASNPTSMALFAYGFEREAALGVFNATSCAGGHGLVAGRLAHLRSRLHVPLGRYRYHLQDVNYVRDRNMHAWDGSFRRRFRCVLDGTTRWGKAGATRDPAASTAHSRCPGAGTYHQACLY